MSFSDIVKSAANGDIMNDAQMHDAMQLMLAGDADHVQMASFLTALKMRGETAGELAVAAQSMCDHAIKINAPSGTIDTCGTGGDGANTFNISTAVAFVLAGCGVPVAKHGNKAVSSLSGSSDILAQLGVNLMADFNIVERALADHNIAFLFAQRHHPAVKNVAPVRAAMGIRTLFNLLGPLTNPASADFHLMGVYDRNLTEPIAHVLKQLGAKAAWVVCGYDGLDEISISGKTQVSALNADGMIETFDLRPEDAGIPTQPIENIRGGDVAENAAAFTALLDGKQSAYRDIVVLNAAAGLMITGHVENIEKAAKKAAHAIDSGAAKMKLEQLVAATN